MSQTFDFAGFTAYLMDEGFATKTVKTYVNAAKRLVEENPAEPWAILRSRRYTKKTKVTYHAALQRWAEFVGDTALEEKLSSRAVKKLLTMRGGKPPKTTQGLPEDHVSLILQVLHDEYKEPFETPEDHVSHPNGWVWPCLRIMIKLGLRGQVDLAWITRAAVVEAIRNTSTLTIVTKGGRERELPIDPVREELRVLAAYEDWGTIADIISPNAMESRRHEAAYERVRRKLKEVAREAGLDPSEIHTHRFRHAAALWMLKETGDIFLVRDLLGHSSVQTTEHYLRTSRTSEIADALRDRFGE